MTPCVLLVREPGADPAVDLPGYATAGAAGADVRANLPEEERAAGLTLAPMERRVVPTGLRVALPQGWEMQVRPRSGLAREHGLTLLNTPGTIDADYRGPLGVLVVNFGHEAVTIRHGQRIAQLVVAPVARAAFEPVETLDETARGAGGFGSTGRD
ncbi:dUTP diphosphatase [Roseitranquillus sediminis]|uniref:dUTP diphosphatase n=1 Tax=Roseitranquillus sediminis TaxID=2809051 RepID=UPI001D0C3952|nr:dUTP diphosphatase [Roseitranquillus sediminis]MBM9595257.1 dUTP diphosphatase [Roseitranquillus sediminis]